MNAIVKLYSDKNGEIFRFLKHFQKKSFAKIENHLLWQKEYENPIEIADIIGAYIENKEQFKINMWISLDKDLFINITPNNADEVICFFFVCFFF